MPTGEVVPEDLEQSSEVDSSDDDDDEPNIADLAGFTPEEQHRPGIIALLNQMFRNSSINPSSIADVIIEKKLGTVITMSEDDDDDDSDDNVFAVTAALNFQQYQNSPGLQALRGFLTKQILQHGSSDTVAFAEDTLKPENPNKCLFLVNERMINLPPDFSLVPLPSVDELKLDDTSSTESDDMIIAILKLYKKSTEQVLSYMHPEQKVFSDIAVKSVDYPVDTTEFGYVFVEGEMEDDPGEDCLPFRRICFIPANIFRTTGVTQLKAAIQQLKAGQ